jgi:phosphomannomutase
VRAYIFDVDGTLTPSSGMIDPNFRDWFLNFATLNAVYLVTGSDHPKTLAQVGEQICKTVKRCYNCSGNSVWEKDNEVYHNDLEITENQDIWLRAQLKLSKFLLRTGNHLEFRPGLLNFSIVGRNADMEERAEYIEWDKATNEREIIAGKFNFCFSGVRAQVAGETGLDIVYTGQDKGQIIKDFEEVPVSFYGDNMREGGNDYSLKQKITKRDNKGDMIHSVTDWQHTWKLLKEEGQ